MRRSLKRTLEKAGALPQLKWRPVGRIKRPIVVWTPEHDAFLGCASDGKLADLWSVPIPCVYARRRRLAIPALGASNTPVHWTTAMLRDLDTLSNRQVAVKYRLGAATVAFKRRERKIAPVQRWNTVVWTAAMLKDVGTLMDKEVAWLHGLVPSTVRKRREELGLPRVIRTKLDWDSPTIRALLGSAHDNRIAKQLGVDPETVRTRRTQFGIAPFSAWTPEAFARIGKEPDRAIAEDIGLTPSAVAWNRNRLGIARWDKRRKGRQK